MPDDGTPAVLASDAEREHSCSVLREASVEGRLTLDEFSLRVDRALAARTRADLLAVTVDLPAVRPSREPIRTSVAVLSSMDRRGFWRVGEQSGAVAVLGSCTLDLRGALISGPVTTIDATVVMGSLEVIVPEGIEVELDGVCFMGSRTVKLAGGPPAIGAPVVRITGTTVMGSVTVRDSPTLGERLSGALDRMLGAGSSTATPQTPPR
jgi:Domain of unknown function (DUF1707)/Cell wall-active antibiotics response 4TMS YvqF